MNKLIFEKKKKKKTHWMTRAHEVQKMTWKLGFCCFDKNLNHSHELFYLNLKVFFIIKINFQYLNLQYAKTELSYQLSKHILESKSSTLYCCTSVRLGLLFPKNLSSTSVWKKKDTCFMNIMVAASNNQMLITSLKQCLSLMVIFYIWVSIYGKSKLILLFQAV